MKFDKNINSSYLGAICSRNLFSCDDSKCLPPSLVCNGKSDCNDSSDEEIECQGKKNQRKFIS